MFLSKCEASTCSRYLLLLTAVFLGVILWKLCPRGLELLRFHEGRDVETPGSYANSSPHSSSPQSTTTAGSDTNLSCHRSFSPFPVLVRSDVSVVSRHIDPHLFIPSPPLGDKRWLWFACDKKQAVALIGQAPKLIFYGDSITEFWTGTKKCLDDPRYMANTKTFKKFFLESYGFTKLFAIAGDTSSMLLWRLQNHTQILSQLRPQAVVLHIGINDIRMIGAACYISPSITVPSKSRKKSKATSITGYSCRPESDFDEEDGRMVFASIQRVIKELWKLCQPVILFSLLLPTGWKWPNNPFGMVVPQVNELLVDFEKTYGAKLNFYTVNCSWVVLNMQTGGIDKNMMTDYLHPSLPAMPRLASCIKQKLNTLLQP